MSNKPVSFSALQNLSEDDKFKLMLSNSLFYTSMPDFANVFARSYTTLASSDMKNLLNSKKRVYFEFSEYSGAVLYSALASLFAQISDDVLCRDLFSPSGIERYRTAVISLDPDNAIGDSIRTGGLGKPKITINMVFSRGNKNITYGFSRASTEEGEDVKVSSDVLLNGEKLSAHHVILHGDARKTTARQEDVFQGRGGRVLVRKIQVEAYDKRITEPPLPICSGAEVTVEKIGIHCIDDGVTFSRVLGLFQEDPLSFLLHVALSGSV